jgi:hypothetical protein
MRKIRIAIVITIIALCAFFIQTAGCTLVMQVADYALSDQRLFFRPDIDSSNYGSPIAVDKNGSIYFTVSDSKQSYLYSVDSDGELKWRVSLKGKLISDEIDLTQAPAIGDNGMIYVSLALPKNQGRFYAIKQDGKIAWVFKDFILPGTPVTGDNGSIYLCSESGLIVALDKNGSRMWSHRSHDADFVQLASGRNGKLYYVDSSGVLYSLKKDGSEEWSYKTGFQYTSSAPFVAKDGTIYLSYSTDNVLAEKGGSRDVDGKVIAVNRNGSKKWEFKGDGTSANLLEDRNGNICFMNNVGAISALNKTGSIKWSHKDRVDLNYNFFFKGLDNKLYLYTGDHSFELYKLKDDGKYESCGYVNWSACQCPTADSKGNIYLNGDNGVYVIKN